MSYAPYPGNSDPNGEGGRPREESAYFGGTTPDGTQFQGSFQESNATPYASAGYTEQGPYGNQYVPGMAPLYPGPAPYFDPYAKSRLVAGLLGIVLGALGIHRFYLGYTAIGIIQIVVSIVTFGIGVIWPLVEGIMIISNSSSFQTDADGRPLRP